MAICDTFSCTNGIGDTVIPNCGDVDYGKKIVKVFLMKTTGAGFPDVSSLIVESNWTTRMGYAATGANSVDRIVALGDLHVGIKPAAEVETEEAPYGGDELVARKHSITFEIKRWNAALITAINNLRCIDQYNFWYLTETGYLFGGIAGYPSASFVWGGLEHAGIGQGKSKSTNAVSWYSKDDSIGYLTTFLKTKTNP
jgi:hypothetical protein